MRLARLATLAAVALLLAACTSSSDEPEGASAPQDTGAASEAPSTSGETETEPETETETETETDAPPVPTAADPGPPARGGPLALDAVASGLSAPVFATAAPGEDDRLYVVEQPGRVRVLVRGKLRDRPFLDIVSQVSSGGERGLLSVAFHPKYESNGLFYVNYTDVNGDTRVVEYRKPPGGEPAETRRLLYVEQPYANHNGGQLAFGPDGRLYVGMGDGGSAGDPENRAQELSERLGKLLRLDVDKPGAEWKMLGYGLRNPWRFSFDRVTGDLWIADVGQGEVEEVDFVSARHLGRRFNFGWDVFEGSLPYEDKQLTPGGILVSPITEYTHDFGCSITGGYVYRGEAARRQAWGRYFHGDYCSGRIWSVSRWKGEVSRRGHPFRVPGLTSFGEDANGELYLLSTDGMIRQLVPRS
jgi:glucose/arabinose dehydrogenase